MHLLFRALSDYRSDRRAGTSGWRALLQACRWIRLRQSARIGTAAGGAGDRPFTGVLLIPAQGREELRVDFGRYMVLRAEGTLKRMGMRINLICAAFLLLAGLVGTAAAGDLPQAPGTLVALTDGDDLVGRHWPAIDGDHVVWTWYDREDRTGIALRTLSTGEEVNFSRRFRANNNPRVSGDFLVRIDDSERERDPPGRREDVYLYSISSGETTCISSETAGPRSLAISGDYVVWEDLRDRQGDIYLYQISTGEERAVCTDWASQSGPDVSGDRIVWTDRRCENDDVYLYTITTGEERALTSAPTDESGPSISGDRVVWVSSSGEVRFHNLTTGRERVLANSSATKSGPSISGDLVVWTEYVFRESDVPDADTHLFDLITDEEMIVHPFGSHSMSDDPISGNRIVWEEGNSVMLFTYERDGTPPPAPTTESPASLAAVLAALALVFAARRWD
ncbi:hypothetical protein [Methanofollis aquaemaris]|nr:hypothetical protein [Methanofollis aquaemaris]